ELVELSFLVNAVTGEVEATYQVGDNPVVSVGKIQTTGKILNAIQQENTALAVGISGTSKNPSQEFIASWDYFKVVGEMPFIIRTLTDIERIMGDTDRVINLNEYFGDNEGVESLTYSIFKNTNSKIGAIISGDSLTLKFPLDAVTSTLTVRATDSKGLFIDQTFNVEVLEEDVILLRINAGGPSLPDTSGQLNWV